MSITNAFKVTRKRALEAGVRRHEEITMSDEIYRAENVNPKFHPIFEQLQEEFPPPYQIWRRIEQLGRCLSAAVLDTRSNVAVFVPISGIATARAACLSPLEVERVRAHFSSGVEQDLTLESSRPLKN